MKKFNDSLPCPSLTNKTMLEALYGEEVQVLQLKINCPIVLLLFYINLMV